MGVSCAVDAVACRLPLDWPIPVMDGAYLYVPRNPEAAELLAEELADRGLKFLADRVLDPIRWRA